MNCMKWRKISRLCNLAPLRGRLAIGNGGGQENFPRERWHHVRPLILFHQLTLLIYTVQLEWLTSIPWPNPIIIIPYPPPLFATKLSWCRSSLFQQNQEAVDWTSSSPPERTQCRQGSMRGGCSTNWNRCLIDGGKPTFQWCARPFDDSFAICAFQKLAQPQPRVASAHLSRTQSDSEGVQERWRGQWVKRAGRVLVGV